MTAAWICDYIRTPFGRYRGGLATVRADDLAALVLSTLMARSPTIDWHHLDEVIMGCANQAGEDNRNVARMSLLLAGLPESIPAITVNRLCASGMSACVMAARAIRAGEADLVIAGGVENMTRAPFVMAKAEQAFSRTAAIADTTIGWRLVNPLVQERFGTDSMPETAENVASARNISRTDQDAFALRSQQRAHAAISGGRMAREIVAVDLPRREPGARLETDEQPRPDTTADRLAALATPFRDNGTVTAGNSSSLNDGAAALLIASDEAVKRWQLTPLCRIVAASAAGVSPRLMGLGPLPAVTALLRRTGLSRESIRLWEINEAFASQVLACARALAIPPEQLNINGGAIALGHPLGASGARIIGTTALNLADLASATHAIATMCVGVGQGEAVALART